MPGGPSFAAPCWNPGRSVPHMYLPTPRCLGMPSQAPNGRRHFLGDVRPRRAAAHLSSDSPSVDHGRCFSPPACSGPASALSPRHVAPASYDPEGIEACQAALSSRPHCACRLASGMPAQGLMRRCRRHVTSPRPPRTRAAPPFTTVSRLEGRKEEAPMVSAKPMAGNRRHRKAREAGLLMRPAIASASIADENPAFAHPAASTTGEWPHGTTHPFTLIHATYMRRSIYE